MLANWKQLLNTDCVVVGIGEHTLFPIFRVGQSTLMSICDRKYINHEIRHCEHIDIMIRDPEQRFVSGVNEYCRQNKIDVAVAWKLIDAGKLYDRHFTPQYLWLMHLYRFYKGPVTLRPFTHISRITDLHLNKSESKIEVPLCDRFIKVDQCLTKHFNETEQLVDLIERYKNVLS